uniref:Tetraspanin n=1 Tax=Hadrurus spadix TaxID=141984 RepID=A0A1W7RAS2_9SCOR
MVQGSMTFVRYTTFAFNFIFLICGIALIAVGAIAHKEGKNLTVFLGSKFPAASILIIVAGCVVLGLSFLGCCGALKESYCMLMTFSVLLFLLFIIELAAGITAFVFRNKLEKVIENNMKDSMKKYNTTTDVTKSWDYVQKKLKCCGVNSSKDWTNVGKPIPESCCADDDCNKETGQYSAGCFKKIDDNIKGHAVQLGVAALVIGFIQLLGLIFGCCLAQAIKKEYETV